MSTSGLKQRPGDQPLPVRNGHPDVQSMVIADIEERRNVGITRYGSALQPHNGRDGIQDLYEELLDGAMYARQLLEERKAIPAARALLGAQQAVAQRWADATPAARDELLTLLAEAADALRAALDGTPQPKDHRPEPGTPHRDGTGQGWDPIRVVATGRLDRAVDAATHTWADTVRAALYEALAENDPTRLLPKVRAVMHKCEAWADDLTRRQGF
ncbi:hypothetical protein [Actinomadura geliboluensis]|uniref:hypothetical protein n=1 Tax=Actinomadura geliboluensis TaxID=882440 RepID=UPI0036A813C4